MWITSYISAKDFVMDIWLLVGWLTSPNCDASACELIVYIECNGHSIIHLERNFEVCNGCISNFMWKGVIDIFTCVTAFGIYFVYECWIAGTVIALIWNIFGNL